MEDLTQTLVTLGGLFLVGLLTDALGRRTRLPRVTLLLVFGFAIGPGGLDLLPDLDRAWFPLVSHIALSMVGFLLGESLSVSRLRAHGREVLWISAAAVLITSVSVIAGLLLAGLSLPIALVLGGIAPATAPAATSDVVREARARGPFSDVLLGVVALDDAWGLIVFSILLAVAQSLIGDGGAVQTLSSAGRTVGGALLLGGALGLPMSYLTGRLRPGEPTVAEALGFVLLCAGLALWLEVSFLLATMTLGTVVANVARHHTRPFHAIEGIEWPFMILFFAFAGALLEVEALTGLGLVGCAYILLRSLGRVAGAWLGASASGAGPGIRRWMGLALMPQAGVALGMTLIACQQIPSLRESVLPLVIATTVIFELGGPVLTRMSLDAVGERGRA